MSKRRNRQPAEVDADDFADVGEKLGPNRSVLVFVPRLGWMMLARWVADPGEDLRDREACQCANCIAMRTPCDACGEPHSLACGCEPAF